MSNQRSPIVRVNAIPYAANYNWSVGIPMEKFIQAFAEKKLLASKCPKCGYTYAPPRNRCGRCTEPIGEKDVLELSGKATLVSYTAAHVQLDGAGNWKDLERPAVIAAIKLDGADSLVFLPLEKAAAKDLKPGQPVEMVWADETTGKIADLKGCKLKKAAGK